MSPAHQGDASVVVVDDHELLRAGTRRILDDADGFVVVAEAADGGSALRVVAQAHPDIVLLDIRLPDASGIDIARELATLDPAPMVLILSAYDDEHYVRAAREAGVAGYLLKTLPAEELVARIRQTRAKPSPDYLVASPRWVPSAEGDETSLTLREREVVRLAARGLANKQIARHLGISPRTVEGHLNHVFEKVGVASRTELVHFALTHGLYVGDDGEDGSSATSSEESDRP